MATLAGLIVPVRGAAQKATASISEQLNDPPGQSNPFREPAQRAKVKYRYSATGKHLSSPLKGGSSPENKTALTPAPASRAPARAGATTSRKRKASFREPAFVSSLSPLSSAPTSPTGQLPPLSKSSSVPSLQHPSPTRKHKRPRTDACDIGNSVWALVSAAGLVLETPAEPAADSGHPMWWPAQVVQKHPLRVSLFGDFPASSSNPRGLCTIFSPSFLNVQPIHNDSGTKRFSRATFRLAPCPDDSPPNKTPRLDQDPSLEDKWESAVQSMEKASTLERDGLPALLSTYATTGDAFNDSDTDIADLRQLLKPTASAPKRSKPTGSARKSKLQRTPSRLDGSRSWSPCPADPTLQIPGELILAMAPKTGGAYWPAQILEHVSDRKEKYKVKFLDDEEHVITRDRFWTSEEDGFVECTLGVWESAIKTTEDPDSGDEGVDDDAKDLDDTCALPPPPPPEDFDGLSLRAQLAYVKPVLRAILNKEYEPARGKHETFMKGGQGRVALLKSAGVRGGMDASFVKGVQRAICEWVLGGTAVKPARLLTEDPASEPNEIGVPPDVTPLDVPLTRDDNMDSVEGAVVPASVPVGKAGTETAAPPPSASENQTEIQDVEMAVDGREQQTVPLVSLTNGIALSPAVTQASKAPKSQLDLLAEVSQAVATEPSLLPSHPEVPKLRVDLLNITHNDASSPPSPLTPVPDEDQPLLAPRDVPAVSQDFESLSVVEKLDYCLNILLPESIQQLLLWRSGERTSAELLSPEEEQRLHDLGARKAAETDWVDDVMRLRAAQARLRGFDKKAEGKKTEIAQGGTRSRPRRATVSRA